MPNLKDLKNRIESVKSTRKITKAMQMVAAAKLRRAQESAEAGRPYSERMSEVMSNLARGISIGEDSPELLAGRTDEKTVLVVVATSERGLCGGFNSSIVKLAKTKIMKLREEGKAVKIFTIGKKGREQLTREFGSMLTDHFDLSKVKNLSYEVADSIAKKIINSFQHLLVKKMPKKVQFMIMNRSRLKFWKSYCRGRSPHRFFRLFWRMLPQNRGQGCLLWTMLLGMLER